MARGPTLARGLAARPAPRGPAPKSSSISSFICRPPRRGSPWSGWRIQRWAIEQQDQQLKDELGLDHFEGRTYPGWNRHVVLTAIAYTFLQQERRRTRGHPLTFPVVRALVCKVFTALYFAAHPKQLDYIIQLRRHLPLRI